MNEALAARLDVALPGRVTRSAPLAGMTTYRLGGPAAVLVELRDDDDLQTMTQVLSDSDPFPDILVIGRGSNLVVSDAGWEGLAVKLGPAFSWTNSDHAPSLAAGGGTPLPQAANKALRAGLTGIEFFVAIPGSVGGAVAMNAGAHGSDVSDVLDSVEVVDLRVGERARIDAMELELAYRHSSVGPSMLVLSASFRLKEADPNEVRERMESFRRHRAATQPGAAQNAGSVFRNPPGDSAGRLVEAAGLKGLTVGGASVSELHANFFIAGEEARAQDVFDLVHEVKTRVRDRFGVELVPEIRFLGRFDSEH